MVQVEQIMDLLLLLFLLLFELLSLLLFLSSFLQLVQLKCPVPYLPLSVLTLAPSPHSVPPPLPHSISHFQQIHS